MRNIGRVRAIGDIERTILALHAGRRSPRSVGGRDLVAELARKRRRNGSFAGLVNQTAFAILALRAGGRAALATARSAPPRAGSPAQHNADGGFNFAGRGGRSGIDDTAAALQGARRRRQALDPRPSRARRRSSPRARTPTAACR